MPVIAAGKYEHELASVLLAYKNHQMVSLGRVLAPVLASALRAGILGLANPQAPVILVPVPTRRQARAGRHVPSGATGQWACCCGGWRPPGRCRQTRGSPTC
ncbi:hypothetical protein GCM10009628_07170 [Paeniglutamicibacter kerguelensis]